MKMRLTYLFLLVFIEFSKCSNSFEIPLAPYNVKLMCRQGRRFSKVAQSPNQCPSSSTSCGFFEFSSQDQKTGSPQTGVYDCVDGGILTEDSGELPEEDNDDRKRPPPFAEMCGAVPKCTVMSVEQLNPAFIKYMVQEYDIKLEGLENINIRFCCALFHSTLQKMVITPDYEFSQNSAMNPPISCQDRTCGPGAVGCLLHAEHGDKDYEEYDDKMMKKRRQKRLSLNDYVEDDDYVNAVELNFDDLDIELITREPEVVETTTLPSLKLPMTIDDLTTTTSTTVAPTSTVDQISSSTSKPKPIIRKLHGDSEEDEDDEPLQTTHCVYRHLNNEFYRYCLLVHQSRDGDRCYHHQGHTICCCFVGPDSETCDPTEMDLVVPPVKTLPPRVIITAPPPTTPSTTTTTTTTSSTTTTTSEPTTTTISPTTTSITPPPVQVVISSTTYPSLPPQIYRPRPIDQIKRRKQMKKKCRVTYVRTKSGSRTRPVLVCDGGSHHFTNYHYYYLFSLLVVFYIYF